MLWSSLFGSENLERPHITWNLDGKCSLSVKKPLWRSVIQPHAVSGIRFLPHLRRTIKLIRISINFPQQKSFIFIILEKHVTVLFLNGFSFLLLGAECHFNSVCVLWISFFSTAFTHTNGALWQNHHTQPLCLRPTLLFCFFSCVKNGI